MSGTRLLVVVAATALISGFASTTQPIRFAIVPPAAQPLNIIGNTRDVAISPDGIRLVYTSEGGQLVVRSLDQLDAVPLRGIRGRSPFFSPDGRWIGFFADTAGGGGGELQKVSVTGGPGVPLCCTQGAPRGGTWGPDGTIVFATSDPGSGLFRVSAAGGDPTVLTTPDPAHGEADHVFPSVLPDGRTVLFTMTSRPIENSRVATLDLVTGERKTLIRGGSQAEYVDPTATSTSSGQASSGQNSPTAATGVSQASSGHTGYLVYAVAGTLMWDPASAGLRPATPDVGSGFSRIAACHT